MPKDFVINGILITFSKNVRVSKNYLWHAEDRQFEDRSTGVRRSDSLYSAKVDVFEDRTRTWFLDWAAKLVHGDLIDDGTSPGDYVAISVALAYIEGIEHYRRGREPDPNRKGAAGNWFRASAGRIFPTASEKAIEMLYKSTRCGLFHSGFTKDRVYISHAHYSVALEKTADGKLHIDPARFVQHVLKDFDAYVHELRANPSGAFAQEFEKLWDMRWASS